MFEPELGQMLSGYFNGYRTPGYVTSGIESIDELAMRHVWGVREVIDKYGPSRDWGACSNSGVIHELPDGAPFALRSYCWCDGMAKGHEDECPPNFHHFATDFRAYWYKHAERGESCNQEITGAQWRGIQRECEDYITSLPRAFRVLVTGSREFAPDLYEPIPGKKWKRLREDWATTPSGDRSAMIEALREARLLAGDAHVRIVHGAARGADELAWRLAGIADNASHEAHPALWNSWEDGEKKTNKAAGFQRNARMVDSDINLCLAFFKKGAGNRGTTHCANLARQRGIDVIEVWA